MATSQAKATREVKKYVSTAGKGSGGIVEPVNLSETLKLFQDDWTSRRIARLSVGAGGFDVRVVKARGAVPWHRHADQDEMHLVLSGELTLEVEGREPVVLRQGEVYVMPAGLSHRGHADQAEVLVLEPHGDGDPAPEIRKRKP
jgi:quercetin dioxygenase-like cupin family protein